MGKPTDQCVRQGALRLPALPEDVLRHERLLGRPVAEGEPAPSSSSSSSADGPKERPSAGTTVASRTLLPGRGGAARDARATGAHLQGAVD